MTKARAALLVLLASVGAYANSLGNDFARDDVGIIRENPAVTSPTLDAVLTGRYWPQAREGAGLYRPVAIGSYALQWRAFGGSPLGFHAVSVIAHTAVALLLLLLLARLAPVGAALTGALLFAVHPLHVEAVANVVGQAELYAAAAVLAACWLYVSGETWEGGKRGARLAAIALLYGVGLGSKEIAVTLPGLLLGLDLVRAHTRAPMRKLSSELPLYTALVAVLGTYLVLRTAVLGTAAGEVAAPALGSLTAGERVLTALSVWPEYVRLLFFPLDLAADYSPALILPATGPSLDVLLGGAILVGTLVLGWRARERAPLVTLGAGWFCLTVLPVSNLLFATGVMLAERTLYLPSVGLSIVVAALVARWPVTATPLERRVALGLGLAAALLLTVRTVLRNPTWFDTFTVLNTLAVEHPESYLAYQSHADGLARIGQLEAASEAYEVAVALAPGNYGLVVSAAEVYGVMGRFARAEELLRHAIAEAPDQPEAYLLLAQHLVRQGRAQEGHGVALEGLTGAGADARLFAVLSESYVSKGDLEAAIRARLAAVGQAPDAAPHWQRIADLYDFMGRPEDAELARARVTPGR